MLTAKITSKGQITIPVEVRKALGLKTGDEIAFFEIERGRFAFWPRTGSIWDLRGCVPKLGRPVTIEEMNEAAADAAADSYGKSAGGRIGRAHPSSGDEAA